MAIIDEKLWWANSCRVLLENNGTEAYLLIETAPDEDQPLTGNGLLEFMNRHNVVYGIDQSVCASVLGNVQSYVGIKTLVAIGSPPVDGVDGVLSIYVEKNPNAGHPMLLEDGSVDFYNLGAIQTATPGQLLARRTPAIAGKEGIAVTGKPVPPRPGKDVRLPTGKGVVVGEDGMSLLAEIEGHIVYLPRDNRLNVFSVYEVKSDVDFGTGNIEFVGSVTIYGNVQPGFKVVAAGDVQVEGYVDAAQIEAGGNVTIRGGIQGRLKGYIHSGGTVRTKFIQNAVVDAVMDCIVQESIMHSRISAGGSVRVEGKRAVIVGGVTSAGKEVHTRVLGSTMATPTEVEVGVHPQLRAEMHKIHEKLTDLKTAIDKTQKALTLLENMVGNGHQLSPDKLVLHNNLTQTLYHYKLEEEEYLERRMQVEAELLDTTESRIVVGEVAHSGLKLTIGQAVTYIRDDLSRVAFILDGGEICTTHV